MKVNVKDLEASLDNNEIIQETISRALEEIFERPEDFGFDPSFCEDDLEDISIGIEVKLMEKS
jgi:hypothetical protein